MSAVVRIKYHKTCPIRLEVQPFQLGTLRLLQSHHIYGSKTEQNFQLFHAKSDERSSTTLTASDWRSSNAITSTGAPKSGKKGSTLSYDGVRGSWARSHSLLGEASYFTSDDATFREDVDWVKEKWYREIDNFARISSAGVKRVRYTKVLYKHCTRFIERYQMAGSESR